MLEIFYFFKGVTVLDLVHCISVYITPENRHHFFLARTMKLILKAQAYATLEIYFNVLATGLQAPTVYGNKRDESSVDTAFHALY